jgi:hypothetical protein
LHLTWVSFNRRLYYSSAPTDQAGSARAWSTPRVLSSSAWGTTALVVDRDDTLHLLYDRNLDNPGVSYMQSTDGGETWSEPVDVSGEIEPDQAAISVRMVMDGRGWLHAGWHQRQMPNNWPPATAKYARSEDGGRTWTEPIIIDAIDRGGFAPGNGPAFVNLAVDGQDNVHLFWLGRPGGQRYHRWSSDGGRTWTEPEPIFPGFSGGYNGWVVAAVDSAGTLHAVTGAGGHGVWYSRWTRTGWTAPVTVDPVEGHDVDPHFPSLVVTEGNRLHLVRHTGYPNSSITVLYSSLRTSAPYVPPQPLPAPVATPTTPTTPTVTVAPTKAPTRTPAATLDLSALPAGSVSSNNPSFAVLAGIVPAVLLVSLVILAQVAWARRRV